jgi:hypothetical protein
LVSLRISLQMTMGAIKRARPGCFATGACQRQRGVQEAKLEARARPCERHMRNPPCLRIPVYPWLLATRVHERHPACLTAPRGGYIPSDRDRPLSSHRVHPLPPGRDGWLSPGRDGPALHGEWSRRLFQARRPSSLGCTVAGCACVASLCSVSPRLLPTGVPRGIASGRDRPRPRANADLHPARDVHPARLQKEIGAWRKRLDRVRSRCRTRALARSVCRAARSIGSSGPAPRSLSTAHRSLSSARGSSGG